MAHEPLFVGKWHRIVSPLFSSSVLVCEVPSGDILLDPRAVMCRDFFLSLEKEDGMLIFPDNGKNIAFFVVLAIMKLKTTFILRPGNYISLNVSHFCCFFCSMALTFKFLFI